MSEPCPAAVEALKIAFLADLDQHYTNSLTPDRNYPVPVDNLLRFLDQHSADLLARLEELTRQRDWAHGQLDVEHRLKAMRESVPIYNTDGEDVTQVTKDRDSLRTALAASQAQVAALRSSLRDMFLDPSELGIDKINAAKALLSAPVPDTSREFFNVSGDEILTGGVVVIKNCYAGGTPLPAHDPSPSQQETIERLTRERDEALRERDGRKHEVEALSNGLRQERAKADLADTYEGWLDQIGQMIGCGHINEALLTCVRQHIEAAEDQRDTATARAEAATELLRQAQGALTTAITYATIHYAGPELRGPMETAKAGITAFLTSAAPSPEPAQDAATVPSGAEAKPGLLSVDDAAAFWKWYDAQPYSDLKNGLYALCWDAALVHCRTKQPPAAPSGDWIEHRGGSCPVPGETMVDVQFREQGNHKAFIPDSRRRADQIGHWNHEGWSDDVVAYRIAQPAPGDGGEVKP